MKKVKYILIAVILVVLLVSCNHYQIDSMLKTGDLIIDGNGEEWENSKYYIKDHNAVFGVINDDKFLYLYFYPTTSELNRQMLSEGLTLWVNSNGKKKEELGIRFIPDTRNFMKERLLDKRDSNKPEDNANIIHTIKEDQGTSSAPIKLQILKPERNVIQNIEPNKLRGIEIGKSSEMDLFAYEIKIPLKGNPEFPVYIDADTSSQIAIGFEIPEPERDENRKEMKDSKQPPRNGGSGGRSGGGMGRDSSNDRGEQKTVQSLKLWTKIQLVEN